MSSPAMVTVAINDRTELSSTDRGAPVLLIGPELDHVTLLFHGDRALAIERMIVELDRLRQTLAQQYAPDVAEADEHLELNEGSERAEAIGWDEGYAAGLAEGVGRGAEAVPA